MVAEKSESIIIPRANKPLPVVLSTAECEEKVQKKYRIQRLKSLSDAMDTWRMRNREKTKKVDVVQIVRECRDAGMHI